MKLFIWTYLSHVSERFHEEGGLLVIAEDLKAAHALIDITIPGICDANNKSPDVIRECDGPELIIAFPDAGCC